MGDSEEAWSKYKAGPLFSPRGNKNHGATKRPFMAGYEAGVAAEQERCARITSDVREFLLSALNESAADEAVGGSGWDVEVDARTILRLLDDGADTAIRADDAVREETDLG